MADYMDYEAEESSDEEYDVKRGRTVLDSEDEEENEKALAKEIDDTGNISGLVDDNVVDDEEEADDDNDSFDSTEDEDQDSDAENVEKKHKKRKRDHRLEDDDFDLIEENLGVKLKKRKKFSRLRTVSSDEDEEDAEQDEKEVIQDQLFYGPADDDVAQAPHPEPEMPLIGDAEEEELSDESDVDDFIVDDNGEPISKPQKGMKRRSKGDSALQNLQDIFGGTFDYADFEKYNEDYEGDDMDEETYYDEQIDDEELAEGSEMLSRRAKKKSKKARKKKSIFDVMEPDTLEKGFYTDIDAEIRSTDIPERFQLRAIPVRPAEESELEMEADWIYKYCFVESTLSKQDPIEDFGSNFNASVLSSLNRKPQSCVGKIQDTLNFMRNQQFETPFIAFYRKEYVEPELNIHDLNKIYHWDEKWTQLNNRKANLTRLLQKMQTYQYEQISADPDKPLGDNVRALSDSDIERIQTVQTMEELRDVYGHFLLHYGRDIPKMQNALRIQRKRERAEEGETPSGEAPTQASDLKQASRRDMYTVCLNAGLGGVANKFGLTPEQFGENLRDNYQRHETEQYPAEPLDLAEDFVCPQFSTKEAVLEGARYMVAMQLAREPLVRQCVRQTFTERAKLTVQPTKKGKKEIDESHPCFRFKWMSNKMVKDLSGPQFLHIQNAETEGLLSVKFHVDMKDAPSAQTYFEEIKQLYYRDEFSHLVQEWNAQRSKAVEFMLNNILYVEMTKEIRTILCNEAKDGIKEQCGLKLRSYLSVAPYLVEEREFDDVDDDTRVGTYVMAISYSEDRNMATFAAVVAGNGEVVDYLRLPSMRFRKNSPNEHEAKEKQKDMEAIKKFVTKRRPHVVVIGVEDRFATTLQEDVRQCVTELEQEGVVSNVAVELMDNELSSVYAATARAQTDFRHFPNELRQAISLARRLQDPLLEFSQLCTTDEDLSCLKLHSLQDMLNKDELLETLAEEFVFRANEVGVDVNRAITHPHTANVVQFVCGLGPRKAANLLKVLKQKNGKLENRSNLVTVCKMGPKIFINCAGFIKIDTKSIMEDSTDAYIEILDGLRVHPETYEWARKMAVDALEYDESAEDANPSSALSEILESPERLKDLDLDAFAEELERQGYGNKGITLYDIRNELNSRYKDFRNPYRPPTSEEKFEIVTKETLSTFREGKLVTCRVTGIAHRRPKSEQLDQAEPHKDEDTGLWSCSFCKTGGFAELSEVWSHLDSGECPGKAVGVRVRLENGIAGFIPTDKLSDKPVNNPEERVQVGMTIHCRILKLDIDRFQVDLTCRGSDLRDDENKWKQQLDTYYDFEAETADKQKSEDTNKNTNQTTYIKRVIAHPSFHNIDFKTAEKMMIEMDQGDTIIRPSSKGSDHLTATWKVAEGVCAHIDIREEKKENAFSLGRSLWIGNEEFEDLDEIIARFIQPMAANARDLINHKNYREVGGKKEVMEDLLKQAKKALPSRIPYLMTASKTLPGKFLLSYMPRVRSKHEYVTVSPDGFRYRGQMFNNLNHLFKWFKEHFRDPIPSHMMSRTPAGSASVNMSITPSTPRSKRHTPRTPKGTPQQTPQAQPGYPYTPNTPYMTPSGGYGRTQASPAGMYPPKQAPPAKWAQPAGTAPKRTPRPKTGPPSAPVPPADWTRAAQEWASKQHAPSPRMTPNTPRGPRTPAGSYKGTPRTPQHRTPRNQRTPGY
uniref:Transcription elongation factor SPT6 n=1 Tax=Phallusia mammillata TaxID=59560 RepID=A0A6F9DUN2_9ASCI|nr:transcription elongation factor SPT6 [Phallusia mammillata]